MPRKKRSWYPNMCHHVMLRGIDGKPTFEDDLDKTRFLLLLQEASELCLFRVHAFCLMTNHIHLLIEPTIEPLTVGVHRFAGRYAQHFNRRHNRRGYVFQGRFRSIVVQDGIYLRRLVRYIHLNPVDAKLVNHPTQYQWSSYHGYLGSTEYTWLNIDYVLSRFGKTRSEAIAEMAVHIESRIDASIDAEEIRNSFRKGGFGDQEFMETYALKEDDDSFEQDKEDADSTIDSLVNTVCEEFEVTLNELCSSEKRQELVRARSVLARAAQMKRGGLRKVCEVLQKHPSTVLRLASVARKDQHLESLATLLIGNSA